MNYRTYLVALAAAVSFNAAAFGNLAVIAEEKVEEPSDSTAFVFTDVTLVPTTSVKDQNKSGTCWCFAGTSMFEDEIVRRGGKPLDLSEMFTVRHCYLDKADRYVRMYGGTNFAAGGSIMDVPYVWKKYGAVPESVYSGLGYGEEKHVHGELDAVLKAYLDAVIRKPDKRISTAWRKGVEAILDAYLGEIPETFEVDGKTYTPRSYADALGLVPDDYVSITSFTQYPVVWAADVSEGGFKWKEGFAVMPKERTEADMDGTELARWVKLSDQERKDKQFAIKGPVEEIEVTPEVRQEMFDRQETTDDHGMEIVGIATDQKGNRYYKVKNSWDTNQVYGGFFYVSEPYFLAKTLSILVHKDGVPSAIAKKLRN